MPPNLSFIIFIIQEKGDGGKAASLSIANVGGIFVVLLGGLALACVTACMEYLWTDRADNRTKKVSSALYFRGTSTLNVS